MRWDAKIGTGLALLLSIATLGVTSEKRVQVRGRGDARVQPMVVTTTWVAERLTDPGLVLLHMGDPAEFEKEHIAGAQLVKFADIATPPPAEGSASLILEMLPAETLKANLERLGVRDESTIVVYFGGNWITPSTRLLLTLEYAGLGARSSLMDGGLAAWKAEGRPVTAEVKEVKQGRVTIVSRSNVIVDAAWVETRLWDKGVAIVDARAPQFYTGEQAGRGPRAGHIPGAVNIPFSSIGEESLKLKGRGAIEELFAQAGVRQGQVVVTYCHIGQQASLLWFVARTLGYEARLYDGSFTEWSAKENLPVEGPKKEK